jgi:hypothetical protein
MAVIGADTGISNGSAGSMEITVVDPKGKKVASKSVGVNTENIIRVEMGDLSEKGREEVKRELQRELKEVMVERRRKKLACF